MKRLNFNNKKAQGQNFIIPIIVLFIFGFISILSYLLLSNITTEFSAAGVLPAGDENGSKFLNAIGLHDWIIVLVMIVLVIAIGITSYKLATAPVFFIITFIMSAFYLFISLFFNYMFSQMVSQSVFNTVIVHFPKTLLICTNFHWIMLANIIIGSITLYAKIEKGQFQ